MPKKFDDEKLKAVILHSTGSTPHHKKRSHGYRNRFAADNGHDEYPLLCELMERGYMVPGCLINTTPDNNYRYYHVTKAGCEFAGMSKAATKRALND